MSTQVTICSAANQILAGLLRGDTSLRPNVMYVEFQQGAKPVESLPEVDPSDSRYYLDLRADTLSDRDFLRIPVASITPRVSNEDPNKLTLLFNGICVGDKGVGGKTTDGARIYGLALVASPTFGTGVDDLTRDLVWARGYYAPTSQVLFSNTAQTVITFKLNLNN